MNPMRRTGYLGSLVFGLVVGGWGEASVQPVSLGLVELRVEVELLCPSCAQGLERRLGRLNHVARVEIQGDEGRLVLVPELGENLDLSEVRDVIRNAGFQPGATWVAVVGRVAHVAGARVLTLSGDDMMLLAAGVQSDKLVAAALDRVVRVTGQVLEPEGGNVDVLHVEVFELL